MIRLYRKSGLFPAWRHRTRNLTRARFVRGVRAGGYWGWCRPAFFGRLKWYWIELRFSRRLTRRELRTLQRALSGQDLQVGVDGVTGCWDDWPGPTSALYFDALLSRLPPWRIRTAPIGYGNPDLQPCEVGFFGGQPVFAERDWVYSARWVPPRKPGPPSEAVCR